MGKDETHLGNPLSIKRNKHLSFESPISKIKSSGKSLYYPKQVEVP